MEQSTPKEMIRLAAILVILFIVAMLCSGCHPERRVMGNAELFKEVGEQWVEFHPCYTVPSVVIKRGDTIIHESIKTDTLIKYDSITHTIEKQFIKTITKDKFRVDTITIKQPDLRLQNQYKDQLTECKIHSANTLQTATDWRNKAVGSWVIGGLVILLLLLLLLRPKLL